MSQIPQRHSNTHGNNHLPHIDKIKIMEDHLYTELYFSSIC